MKSHLRSGPVALTVVALLVFATQSIAFAAQPVERKGFFGEVTFVAADSVRLLLNDGQVVDIQVDPSDVDLSKGIGAGTDPSGGEGGSGLSDGVTLADILSEGMRLAVLAEFRSGEWFAVQLSPIHARTEDKHLTVTVVAISGDTVIAESGIGDEIIVELEFQPGEDLTG